MMSDFATATIFRRRQILEDALADVLKAVGDVRHDSQMGRCLRGYERIHGIDKPFGIEGAVVATVFDVSIDRLAERLEVLLS